MDGPQGMLAEALRLLRLTLPPELAEAFSYFSQAGTPKSHGGRASASRRSRKSMAVGSAISPRTSASVLGDGDKDTDEGTDDEAACGAASNA